MCYGPSQVHLRSLGPAGAYPEALRNVTGTADKMESLLSLLSVP